MDVFGFDDFSACKAPAQLLTHINTPRLVLRMLAGLI
jgi:hypothetical protein